MQITTETNIGELLDIDRGTAKFLMDIGMHCLGCPSSRGENIAQACAVHGVDAQELCKKINEYLAAKEQ